MSALADELRILEWEEAYPTPEARMRVRMQLQGDQAELRQFLDQGVLPKEPSVTAESVPELIAALESPHWTVVWSALWLLGPLRDPRAVAPLLALVSDVTVEPDLAGVAAKALETLVQLEHQAALEAALAAWRAENSVFSSLVRSPLLGMIRRLERERAKPLPPPPPTREEAEALFQDWSQLPSQAFYERYGHHFQNVQGHLYLADPVFCLPLCAALEREDDPQRRQRLLEMLQHQNNPAAVPTSLTMARRTWEALVAQVTEAFEQIMTSRLELPPSMHEPYHLLTRLLRTLATLKPQAALPFLDELRVHGEASDPEQMASKEGFARYFVSSMVLTEAESAYQAILLHHNPPTNARAEELVAQIRAQALGHEGAEATLAALGLAEVALSRFPGDDPQEVTEVLGQLSWGVVQLHRRGQEPGAYLAQSIAEALGEGALNRLRENSGGALRHSFRVNASAQKQQRERQQQYKREVAPYCGHPLLAAPLLAALEQETDPEALQVLWTQLEYLRESERKAQAQSVLQRRQRTRHAFSVADPFIAAEYCAWRRTDEFQKTLAMLLTVSSPKVGA